MAARSNPATTRSASRSRALRRPLSVLNNTPLDTTPYYALHFWANGGATGGQTLQVKFRIDNNLQTTGYLGALAANTWTEFYFSLQNLGGVAGQSVDGLDITDSLRFRSLSAGLLCG